MIPKLLTWYGRRRREREAERRAKRTGEVVTNASGFLSSKSISLTTTKISNFSDLTFMEELTFSEDGEILLKDDGTPLLRVHESSSDDHLVLVDLPERPRSSRARLGHVVLAIAVRLLPPSERARYLEEFRAELLDVPPNTRLSHALSLLRGVFVLRLRRGFKTEAADAAARRAKG
jgi:hypothetical protein